MLFHKICHNVEMTTVTVCLLSLSPTTRATEYTCYILERVIQISRLLGKYPRSRLLANENNNFSFSITSRREFSVLAQSCLNAIFLLAQSAQSIVYYVTSA